MSLVQVLSAFILTIGFLGGLFLLFAWDERRTEPARHRSAPREVRFWTNAYCWINGCPWIDADPLGPTRTISCRRCGRPHPSTPEAP